VISLHTAGKDHSNDSLIKEEEKEYKKNKHFHNERNSSVTRIENF
jgi:hypothetical protein